MRASEDADGPLIAHQSGPFLMGTRSHASFLCLFPGLQPSLFRQQTLRPIDQPCRSTRCSVSPRTTQNMYAVSLAQRFYFDTSRQKPLKDLVRQTALHVMNNGGVVRKISSWGTLSLPQRMRRHKQAHYIGEYVRFLSWLSASSCILCSQVIGPCTSMSRRRLCADWIGSCGRTQG